MGSGNSAPWQWFARASLAVGISAGFGLGALLFVSLLSGASNGTWWLAAVQAHGHAQIFGFAGLMVLGVGLHFLPRLASIPPPPPDRVSFGFWVIATGLTVRVVCQPMLGVVKRDPLHQLLQAGWVLGSLAETAGAAALLVLLAGAFRAALPLRPGAAIKPVLPFMLVAFASLLLYLAGSSLAALDAVRAGASLLEFQHSDTLALAGFYGFLAPMSVAMSIRLFPLYFRTQPTRLRLAQIGLALLLSGLLIRVLDDGTGRLSPDSAGRMLILAAAVCFAASLRIFEARRQLPRRRVQIWKEPADMHAISAYVWLLVAGLVQIRGDGWRSLEYHLLGTGFVTLLILGSGVHLIPGFARQPIRDRRYVWSTLLLGNLAMVCRIVPAAPALHLPIALERSLGAVAGIAGVAALCVFAINLGAALETRNDTAARGSSPAREPQTPIN